MSGREAPRRSRRMLGAAVLGVGAAAAAAWTLQRRSVASVVVSEEDFETEGLVLPGGLTHRFVDVDDGGRIHVVEGGEGQPVVLLHGFMLDSTIWAHQFRDLLDRHRLIAIDHRGHGRSVPGRDGFATPEGRTGAGEVMDVGSVGSNAARTVALSAAGAGAPGLQRLAADLATVLESLDVEDALLVGHSMGGMVALQLAKDFPATLRARTCGLVLVSTMAGPFSSMPGWSGFVRVTAPVSARAVLVAERLGATAVPSRDLRYWLVRLGFGGDAPPVQVRFAESLHLATSPRTVAGLLPSLAVFDLSECLGSIQEPALVVVGTHDRVTPPRQARRMADALEHAELVELPRCGHMAMVERPHEFSHLLDEFSAKTSSS